MSDYNNDFREFMAWKQSQMNNNPRYNPQPQPLQNYTQPQQQIKPVVPAHQYYFVNGIAGAQAWEVPAGGSAVLFDSEEDFYYTKTAGADGKSTIEKYRFERVDMNEEKEKENALLTGLLDRIANLETELNSLKQSKPSHSPANNKKNVTKEVNADE